jgi:hypothetical protein
MGRLDDIIERNQRALKADPVKLPRLSREADSAVPEAPPPRMFESVVAPRKSTTAAWKVIPFMLLIAAVIGWKTCSTMQAEERDQQRREELWRDRRP